MAKDFLTEAFLTLKDRWKAEDALQEAFCRLWGRKYSPMNVMDKKYWPEFSIWSVGVAVSLLK